MSRIFNLRTSLHVAAVILFLTQSCDISKKYERAERDKINEFLFNNSDLDFELKPSGLYYLEVEAGEGRLAITHDTAFVKYTGKFLNGIVFTSNVETNDTLIRPVNEGRLISGFDEGLTYMKVGGKSTMLIPSNLAYGSYGSYPYIDGYTPLLFEVELVKVIPGPGK